MRDIVVITGGASGIGQAVFDAVLAEGGVAVALDRDGATLAARRETYASAAGAAHFYEVDITDESSVETVVAAVEEQVGPITGLVNSAGIGRDIPCLDTSAAIFRQIVDINLVGSFVVSQCVARRMTGRGRGSIVNIASVSGLRGNRGRVAYGASKGGVITMTKVMAVELADLGVRVNAVAPGPVETPMVAVMHTKAVREAWHATVPMRRYGTPDEIARMVMFLLEGDESGYITGQTISVDGGFSIAGIM